MNPVESGYISGTDILFLKDSICNVYLIKLEDGYIAIDAGASEKEVARLLKEYDIDPTQILYVFLTHSDSDHVAALGLFKNAKIYLPKAEVSLLSGALKRQPVVKNSLPDNIQLNDVTLLDDNDELHIEKYTIKALLTPGHTLGSMSYIFDEQYVYSGDAVRFKKGRMVLHPFTMNKKESKNSIEKIRVLYERGLTILTAHYGINRK